MEEIALHFSYSIGTLLKLLNIDSMNYRDLLQIAIDEAQKGKKEGGIPIGAALFGPNGELLGKGHNRRIQNGDPSTHAETDAFRNAGRLKSYKDTLLVTTLTPCWYCCGLVKQFKIGTVVVGESVNFIGGQEWLRQQGVKIIDLRSDQCIELLRAYITENPSIWNEDIGES